MWHQCYCSGSERYQSVTDHLIEGHSDFKSKKYSFFEETFNNVFVTFDAQHQRVISRARSEKLSSWLSVIPIAKNGFDLSSVEFRDGLSIRYMKPLLRVPEVCDGCGTRFDLSHALSCRKGGLVTRRHNEIRDTIASLSSLVWNQFI